MSETAAPTEAVVAPPTHEHGAVPNEPGAHAHPTEAIYLGVAAVLAVLTAIEVALYYLKGSYIYVPLLILMVLKFIIVASFFMHLRFDSRLFRRLFMMGLGMAVFIYIAMFFEVGFFHA